MRVVRIITRLNVGGPALQATLLTDRLDPARFATTLVSGSVGAHEADLTQLTGARRPHVVVRAMRREIHPVDDVRALVALVRLLRAQRPDVVHTHLAKAGLLGRVAARLAGVPVVVHTFHGNVLQGYFGRVATSVFLALERLLARGTSAIVAISDEQAEEIHALRIAGGERLVRVPLGLDLAPFLDPPRGQLRAELGIGPERPLVGIVARLVPIKAVHVFVDAAAMVQQRHPGTTFVVVGDGELRADLESRSLALGLGSFVRFLGWRADLPAIYGDLDVLVLTSKNEGTPVSVIEALAASRAVVATRVGGVPDLLESPECGVTVPSGDANAVANAISSLLADPARRERLGRAGRARVYPEHDISTLVRRIEELYDGLLARRLGQASSKR